MSSGRAEDGLGDGSDKKEVERIKHSSSCSGENLVQWGLHGMMNDES